jgi:c-di-AMP phosphodiesterase-like protein
MLGKFFNEHYLHFFFTAIFMMVMVPAVCLAKLAFGFQAQLTVIDMLIVSGVIIAIGFLRHHKKQQAVHHG